MDVKLKILFLEDVRSDAELVWYEITKNGISFEKLLVDNKKDFIEGIDSFSPNIIISDFSLPTFDGMTALKIRNEKVPQIPFILVTGTINEEVAVECMKAGADDYILKENLSRLGPALNNSIKKIELIKQKNEAETALRESEERYRVLYNDAIVGLYRINPHGEILRANTTLVKILGFKSLEELKKRGFNETGFGPTYIRQDFIDKLEKEGEINDFEAIWIRNNGEEIFVRESAKANYSSDGELLFFDGTVQDITEQKKAEEKLLESYIFNESLLKTIPFGMDIVDEEGNILFISDNFKRIFGEESYNKKCWELCRDDKKQCIDCPLLKGITIGHTDAYEAHGIFGNRIFEINHTGMVYQGKKAMLEIFQDITDRKETEAELIRAKDKAEESDRLKTAFLHNISHEIRTPMNAIVGFSALLGEPDVDAQTRKAYLDVIMQSSDHLLSIIGDIVEISNIEANLVKITLSEVDINSLLLSIYNQILPLAKEKRIDLSYESLLSDSDALVITDGTKLKQIILNLINNSLKFTEKGDIRIVCDHKNGFLEFSVADTGIGIMPEHQSRIFDRFYQVQSSLTRLYEGTGLGLSISKAYLELMGGEISLWSVPGQGTKFFFTLPYKKPKNEKKPDKEISDVNNLLFPENITVLVVEDVYSNFKLINYFLNGTNTKIIHASNGREAVDIALSGKNIDLILMDIRMPVMDGYSATKIIREANTFIPIIAQTAYADDKKKVFESGCNGFISKPFNKSQLLAVMNEFLKKGN